MFLIASYDVDPGSYVPRVTTMTEFNLWTWNTRVFPGIDPLVVRRGDRVRVRMGNLSMTNHPIHNTVSRSRSPAPTAAGSRRARAAPR